MLFLRRIRDWADRVFSKYRYDRTNPWKSSKKAAEFYKIDGTLVLRNMETDHDPLTAKADEVIVLHNAGSSHVIWEDQKPETHGSELLERVTKIPKETRQAVIDDFNRTLSLLGHDLDEKEIGQRIEMLDHDLAKENDRMKMRSVG